MASTMKEMDRSRGFNVHSGFMNKHPQYGSHHSLYPRGGLNSMYSQSNGPGSSATFGDGSMGALTQGLNAMGLSGLPFDGPGKANAQLPNTGVDYGNLHVGHGMPAPMWNAAGQYMMHGTQNVHNGGLQPIGNLPAAGYYPHMGQQFMPNAAYHAHPNAGAENSPISSHWPSRLPSAEMPTLITPRRDSNSSNEPDVPGTPFTSQSNYHGGVTVVDRSPSAMYTHSTPSPHNLTPPYGMPHKAQVHPSPVPITLQLLTQREPAIPHAIPAPSSPLKPLDRALQNPNGETNVYIRGLQPETTDEDLQQWGKRFGDIMSSKAIIDHSTGLCKGFGFVKYHNYQNAEDCIRGFHHLGYEVSFARESFYSKLKKFADETNTNLYVSNLPRNMNEHELGSIFVPHKVCSSRILRDDAGNGRGVGFARFESRDICEEIIKQFNNYTIEGPDSEEYVIQIRYADTEQQKWLKQQTAAARQFRTAEYEAATQGRTQVLLAGGHRNGMPDGEKFSPAESEVSANGKSELSARGGPRYAPPFVRQMAARNTLPTIPSRRSMSPLSAVKNTKVDADEDKENKKDAAIPTGTTDKGQD